VHAVKGRKKEENKGEVRKRGERKECRNNLNASRIVSAICCRYYFHCWETSLFFCLKERETSILW